MSRVKYPRTFHFPWSLGLSDDDKAHSLDVRECQDAEIPQLNWSMIPAPTNVDYVRTLVEGALREHIRPALRLSTGAEFLAAFVADAAAFSKKVVAVNVLLAPEASEKESSAVGSLVRAAEAAKRPDLAAAFDETWASLARSGKVYRRILSTPSLAGALTQEVRDEYHGHYYRCAWGHAACWVSLHEDVDVADDVLAMARDMMVAAADQAYETFRRIEWDAGVPSPGVARWAFARAAQRRFGTSATMGSPPDAEESKCIR